MNRKYNTNNACVYVNAGWYNKSEGEQKKNLNWNRWKSKTDEDEDEMKYI